MIRSNDFIHLNIGKREIVGLELSEIWSDSVYFNIVHPLSKLKKGIL